MKDVIQSDCNNATDNYFSLWPGLRTHINDVHWECKQNLLSAPSAGLVPTLHQNFSTTESLHFYSFITTTTQPQLSKQNSPDMFNGYKYSNLINRFSSWLNSFNFESIIWQLLQASGYRRPKYWEQILIDGSCVKIS